MVATKARPRMTVDDYMKLPEGTLAELIEGEICMSPSPKDRHQKIVGNLYFLLRAFAERTKAGQVRVAPDDVHLPSGDIVQPDVLFIASSNLGILQDWIRGTPDLLIEVLSPEHVERDRIVKRNLYERNGVKEYWMVDDVSRSVEVLSLHGAGYEPAGYFREGETVVSSLLPGLRLSVSDILA